MVSALADRRRAWANALIERVSGPVARYGTPEWLALPNGPEKIAAVVIAAECWALDGDHLLERLAAEVEAERIAHKRAEDADYIARRDAHRAAWDGKAGRFRPDPRIGEEVERDWRRWVDGGDPS